MLLSKYESPNIAPGFDYYTLFAAKKEKNRQA